jgi:hypothetical protein
VKLLDWIKGAVGITKAPSARQNAEPPRHAPERSESPAEVHRPSPPPPVQQESPRPVEIEPERRTGTDSEPAVDAKPSEPIAVDAKPPEPIAAGAPAQSAEPQTQVVVETAPVPSQDEIERRRGMVRRYFNDYWSSIEDKPASFAERLDGAEAYINERVAAGGEPWQLDPATRKQLGLPPRKR